MTLEDLSHVSRGLGPNEWWDAVTGRDEYGELLTTFMHKRWGISLQIYHDSRRSFLPFRFIPNLGWISNSPKGYAQAVLMLGSGKVEVVDYWFASRHLQELNNARETDTILPASMEMGEWSGRRVGNVMLIENFDLLYSSQDDCFTERRQLLLTEQGFIFLGMGGTTVSVQYNENGELVPPGTPESYLEGDFCYLSESAAIRSTVMPALLGVPPNEVTEPYDKLCAAMKEMAVQQRANNPFSRMLAPYAYTNTRKHGWKWIGKGTGNMLDGSKVFGE